LPWDAADPYSFYEQRRRDSGVVWDETAQAWLVLSYDAARQVLSEPGWTSNPQANPNTRLAFDSLGSDLVDSSMLFTDGAVHHRLRGSVRDVFTRTFITGLNAGVEAIASAVVNHPPTATTFDFMAHIALPLPIVVAGEWLGLDAESSQLLREQSPAIIRMLGALADTDEIAAGAAAAASLVTEFLPLAAERRSRPGDDLLSFIASDPDLRLDEVVINAILIAIAGHETTANLLGTAMIRLLTPGRDGSRIMDGLDAVDAPVINELLRLDGPVQATARTATQNKVIGEVEIRSGETALVIIAAANRDPAVFERPAEFWLTRTGPAPLAFGHGAHYCLGASLARLETTVALRRILARNPALTGDVTWRDTQAIRGPLTVPMAFART
jgi:cytochrome P450